MLREVAQRKDLRPLKRASARLSESVLCALSPSRPSRPGGGTARPHTLWILCLHARLLAETCNFPNPHSDAFIVRRGCAQGSDKVSVWAGGQRVGGSTSGSGPVGQAGTPAVAPACGAGGRGAGPQAGQQHIHTSFSKEVRTYQDKFVGLTVIICVRYGYVRTHFSREQWFGVQSDLIVRVTTVNEN